MAPFSFIKISTLIFAYLFLWYPTNDQHQVSALSTLNHDDVSDGSNSTLSSSEEDIHKTNVRAKSLGSDGPHVPHKGYGDYQPPVLSGGEAPLRRAGVGSFASSPLKRGGGGTFPFEDPFVSLRELHANSAQLNIPKDAKNVKDQFRRICKRIFCRRAMKHRSILLLILGILICCVLFLCCGIANPSLFPESGTAATAATAVVTWESFIGRGIIAIMGPIILCALLAFYYWRARRKCNKREKF